MEIGLIGVGKMGGGLLRRWVAAGHTVVAYDPEPPAQAVITEAGGTAAVSVMELVDQLSAPRVVWLMVPAGAVVQTVITELAGSLQAGDIVIDGGNSRYTDSLQHAEAFDAHGVKFVDVGVSGGVAGEQQGYALMAGGDKEVVEQLMPVFEALAAPNAFAHVGAVGAGHFVKMVHNAVEYGMMQAIGEGFDLLQNGPYGDIDTAQVAKLWSHGTIVRSFLMELAASALAKDATLDEIASYVDDNGEGRWAVQTAVEQAVPFWVNTAALYARFDSRNQDTFALKLVAALRKEFGGHSTKKSN